jgi:uncharacterized 2Fe-2S/4Fe-4S cluster protein (DUF4445 family)
MWYNIPVSVVNFVNQNVKIEVSAGTPLVIAARSMGITIETPCNGIGTCGKCKVRLAGAEKQNEFILACQTKVINDIDVIHSERTEENRNLRIILAGDTFDYEMKPFISKAYEAGKTKVFGGKTLLGTEDGDTSPHIYGIALDIGTTTMAAELYRLTDGQYLASDSILNPQSAYGQDVLSRIAFAKDGGLGCLYEAFKTAFLKLTDSVTQIAGVDRRHIYELVFSGNTVMLHFATYTDPSPLGRFPYRSSMRGGENLPAVGLAISPFGLVFLPPIISSYVGADISSGILISKLKEKKGKTLFIDVGTNGEIVMADGGRLAATSTAAGPAFEGMNIVCGMRAAPGAIEQFQITADGGFTHKTIGGGIASGICGSGLLDIVGELARVGVIGKSGLLIKKEECNFSGEIKASLGEHNGKTAFFITDDVFITQQDIRQVQLAKGAIYSGIMALLNKLCIKTPDIDEVLIAGSFGYHLAENSLLNIGLLPREFQGKVRFTGNTSLSGAVAFLLNTDFRKNMIDTVMNIDKIELADTEGFEDIFVSSLGF